MSDSSSQSLLAKEIPLAITRNEFTLTYPVWAWFLNILPLVFQCIIYERHSQVNLKPIATSFLQMKCPPLWSNIILRTEHYHNKQTVNHSVYYPKEHSHVQAVCSEWYGVVRTVSAIAWSILCPELPLTERDTECCPRLDPTSAVWTNMTCFLSFQVLHAALNVVRLSGWCLLFQCGLSVKSTLNRRHGPIAPLHERTSSSALLFHRIANPSHRKATLPTWPMYTNCRCTGFGHKCFFGLYITNAIALPIYWFATRICAELAWSLWVAWHATSFQIAPSGGWMYRLNVFATRIKSWPVQIDNVGSKELCPDLDDTTVLSPMF